MNKELRTARKNQIEFCSLAASGFELQQGIACIFELFSIKIDKRSIFADEYQVSRDQLQSMYESIANQDSVFQEHASLFEDYLRSAYIDKDEFLQILDDLIHKSDQQNPQILISWSDTNKPIDLNDIKDIQSISDIILNETLASIPADGLSIEEAFILYVKAMYWGEGDCFYMVTEDQDGININNSDCPFTEIEAEQAGINNQKE